MEPKTKLNNVVFMCPHCLNPLLKGKNREQIQDAALKLVEKDFFCRHCQRKVTNFTVHEEWV